MESVSADGDVSSADESSMLDPNDILYESELGDLLNPPAGSKNDPATPAKEPRVDKSGEPTSSEENVSTSATKNTKALMAKLAELDDGEDGPQD